MKSVYHKLFACLLVFGAVTTTYAGGGDVVTIDGKQYSLYHVKAGETLYSISQSTGVDIAELKKVNRIDGNTGGVKTDDIIIVPISAKGKTAAKEKTITETVTVKTKEVTKETIKTVAPVAPKGSTTHTVKAGEGLFAIARQYGSSAAAIRSANNLTSDGLKEGQTLIIPGTDKKTFTPEKVAAPVATTKSATTPTTKTAPTPVIKTSITTTAAPTPPTVAKPVSVKEMKANEPIADEIDPKLDLKMMNSLKATYDNESRGKGTVESIRGVATMMQESGPENGSKFYAMHKTAPVGKVLKVRNIMNNRITYVKVIGKLPDTSENQTVMVKVSGAAGKYLKVLDAKFQCEVTEYK